MGNENIYIRFGVSGSGSGLGWVLALVEVFFQLLQF